MSTKTLTFNFIGRGELMRRVSEKLQTLPLGFGHHISNTKVIGLADLGIGRTLK